MKEMKRDILSENPQLRKQAYTAPDGYFEEFRSQINPYREAQQKWTEKLVPFVSMAAYFPLIYYFNKEIHKVNGFFNRKYKDFIFFFKN